MEKILKVNNYEFKIQNNGSVVKVTVPDGGEIWECSFPSMFYSTPNKFIGHVVGLELAYINK